MGLFDRFKKKDTPADKLKTIAYRGGIVRFNIPANWVEEYEEDGGATFYENRPDSGTLRLNILTAKAPDDIEGDLPVHALSTLPDVNPEEITKLGNGNALVRSLERTEEEGQKITLYWWYLANHVPPNYVRMANFSYTILTSQENLDSFKEEIQLLDEQIKHAVFHPELGE
jgi:hypothetical protein